jgi:hypothetical protein
MSGAGAGAGAVAAAAGAAASEYRLSPRPLSFWKAQEAFLEKQIAKDMEPLTKANIKGLECKITRTGRITYEKSAFERLSANTQEMRSDIYHYRKKVPAYTQLLEGCQTYFYPYFTVIPSDFAHLVVGGGGEEETLKVGEEQIKGLDITRLFAGGYDSALAEKWDAFDEISESYERKTPYLVYRELVQRLVPQIQKLENNGKPLCVSLFVIGANTMAHALACILWKKDDIFNIGLYDPLYYIRDDVLQTYYLSTTYIILKDVFTMAEIPREKQVYHNLSALCIAGSKTHCVQYMINAQYCSIYVFYFFYLYALDNFPTTEEGFKKIIRGTYRVKPALLRRSPCTETNLFRLAHIQFAMNTILLYTDSPDRHKEVDLLYKYIEKETGYKLLTDEMVARIGVAAPSNAVAQPKTTGGSRRQTRRCTRVPKNRDPRTLCGRRRR